MKYSIVILCLALSLTACQSSPRPNRGGEATLTMVQTPPAGDKTTPTIRTEATVRNDENPKRALEVSVTPMGVKVNTGGSTPFDGWDSLSADPLFWIGGGLIVIGITCLVLSKYPIAGILVPSTAGWYAIIGGAGIIMLPYVGEGVKDAVPVILIVGGLAAVLYLGWKLKWFERAVGPEAQNERLKKGDKDTAAALAYLENKGDKDKARAVKAGGTPTTQGTQP